jgi:hypothetical protein
MPALRQQTNDFEVVEIAAVDNVVTVLTCGGSESGVVAAELARRHAPLPRLLGAAVDAARLRQGSTQPDEEYLARIALGDFDESERRSTVMPGGGPEDVNRSLLTLYRRLAIKTLGFRRASSQGALLRELLADGEERVRAEAALALGWFGDKDAIPLLRTALGESAGPIAAAAFRSLVLLGDELALKRAQESLSRNGVGTLATTVARITGGDASSSVWEGNWLSRAQPIAGSVCPPLD